MDAPKNDTPPEDFLPLRPAVFLILLSLAEARRHGYALARAVEARSGGTVKLATGPLYRHLKRMLEAGLVEETDQRPSPDQDDERRRYYRLTELGLEVMALEAKRMAGLVERARELGVPGEAW